ncbi:Uncharacterised protein [Mycobacteroides abscessus subsp. abscessus]|nr:Uncharacterised protein [Mycobacteroides abscessus subsp. abscessus]
MSLASRPCAGSPHSRMTPPVPPVYWAVTPVSFIVTEYAVPGAG